ncbi:hypothetical protein KMAL_29640 [Novacetimonas maltaceti]|uniref:Uncharacterized protein n=2 Tax=Acetobacteraceae TaxID=433 RepID=A0A2S3VXT9_9PROT|nr:hypothetical protein KMAL_29640 [Novacetimonas maltaceti]GAN96442.1 hypothetical protein Geu3261_0069_019 [Komagataeibacter europaeus NBRC 3261]
MTVARGSVPVPGMIGKGLHERSDDRACRTSCARAISLLDCPEYPFMGGVSGFRQPMLFHDGTPCLTRCNKKVSIKFNQGFIMGRFGDRQMKCRIRFEKPIKITARSPLSAHLERFLQLPNIPGGPMSCSQSGRFRFQNDTQFKMIPETGSRDTPHNCGRVKFKADISSVPLPDFQHVSMGQNTNSLPHRIPPNLQHLRKFSLFWDTLSDGPGPAFDFFPHGINRAIDEGTTGKLGK